MASLWKGGFPRPSTLGNQGLRLGQGWLKKQGCNVGELFLLQARVGWVDNDGVPARRKPANRDDAIEGLRLCTPGSVTGQFDIVDIDGDDPAADSACQLHPVAHIGAAQAEDSCRLVADSAGLFHKRVAHVMRRKRKGRAGRQNGYSEQGDQGSQEEQFFEFEHLDMVLFRLIGERLPGWGSGSVVR